MADSFLQVLELKDRFTGPMRRAQSSTKDFSKSVVSAQRASNTFGKQLNHTERGLSRFARSGIQQAGYQVGDFFVQIGSGTDATRAFGQQMSQLAGIFGPFGAVLGAVVAIGAAYKTFLDQAAKEAGDLATASTILNDALGKTEEFSGDLATAFDKIKNKYGEVTEETIALVNAERALNEILRQNAVIKATTALQGFSTEISQAQRNVKALNSLSEESRTLAFAFGLFTTTTKDLAKDLGTTTDGASALAKAFQAVVDASPDEKLNAIKRAQALLAQLTGLTTEKSVQLRDTLTQLGVAASNTGEGFSKLTLEEVKAAKAAEDAAKKAGEAKHKYDGLAQGIGQSFGNVIGDIVAGNEKLENSFGKMAKAIINELIQIMIVREIATGISGGLQSRFPQTFGSPKAIGGPVQRGRTTLVGERGPELFVANSAGSIIPNNELGGGGVTVNQTINVTTGVQQTVRNEIQTMMPQIQAASKQAVLDASRRGGSYANSMKR